MTDSRIWAENLELRCSCTNENFGEDLVMRQTLKAAPIWVNKRTTSLAWRYIDDKICN